jgi:hypothetical protein
MKRTFEPGDVVTSFTGQVGMVISIGTLASVKTRRPGYYFAPGCCHNPDYITQVPVFFEDGTFDVMRAMNIKKKSEFSEEERAKIQKLMEIEK